MNDKPGYITPARYRIVIQGSVPRGWEDRLGDLVVSRSESLEVTNLEGTVSDQAGLFGVLSSLHDLHRSLISVEYLGSPDRVRKGH